MKIINYKEEDKYIGSEILKFVDKAINLFDTVEIRYFNNESLLPLKGDIKTIYCINNSYLKGWNGSGYYNTNTNKKCISTSYGDFYVKKEDINLNNYGNLICNIYVIKDETFSNSFVKYFYNGVYLDLISSNNTTILSWFVFIWKLFTGFTIEELRLLTNSQLTLVSSFQCKEQGRIKDWYYDSADTTSTDNGGTILVTTSGKRIKATNYDYLKPENFGAKVYQNFYTKTVTGTVNGITVNICDGYFEDSSFTIPVYDSTDEIQACLDFADATIKKVHLSKGSYFFTQIAFPDGIYCRGTGTGDFGRRNEGAGHTPPDEGNQDVTVLMQLTNVNDDAIVFRTFRSLDQERITGINFGNFILRGNNSNTVGRGISLRNIGTDRDDIDNYAGLNGTHDISHIQIREFPESGFFNWKGGVPGYLSHINCYWNGGYGIEWLGQNSGNGVVVFNNCDGDANTAGAVIKISSTLSGGVFNFYSTRGEMKPNPYYGATTGFKYAQPYVIEIGDSYRDCSVNIYGAFGNKYTPDTTLGDDVTEAIILVNTTSEINTPTITFSGLSSITNEGIGYNNNYTLKDIRLSFNIPKGCRSGIYNLGSNHFDGIFNPVKPKWIIGKEAISPANAVADAVCHVIGSLPSIGVTETDVADDLSGFIFTQSGGGIQLRNLKKSGGTNNLVIYNKNSDGTHKSTQHFYDTDGNFQLSSKNSVADIYNVTDADTDEKNIRIAQLKDKFIIGTIKDDGSSAYSFLEFFRSGFIPKIIRPKVPIVLGNYYDSNSNTAIATLTVNSTAPDVSKSNYFQTANTSSTFINYFSGATPAQIIIIECKDDFTTLKHDAVGFGNGRFYLKNRRDTKLINGRTYLFVRGSVFTEEITGTIAEEYNTVTLTSGTSGNITISGLTPNAIVQLSIKTHSGTIANFDYTATSNNLVINARNTSGTVETGNNSTIVYRILKY